MNDQQPLDNSNPDSLPEAIETVLAEQDQGINFPGAIAGGLLGGALGPFPKTCPPAARNTTK
jgi:hypothetical protein